jgi:hypothetical protein
MKEFRAFNNLYAISRDGDVLRKNTPYTPPTRKDGYQSIGRSGLLHRAVAATWIRPINPGEHVHHINHDRSDNRAENLEIVAVADHIKIKHSDDLYRFAHSKMSDAAKQRLRDLRTGKPMPESTKQKIGEAIRRLGIKPPVTRGPLSASALKKRIEQPHRKTPCVVFGIQFKTIRDASAHFGIKPGTLRRRCYSSNFPDYSISTQPI